MSGGPLKNTRYDTRSYIPYIRLFLPSSFLLLRGSLSLFLSSSLPLSFSRLSFAHVIITVIILASFAFLLLFFFLWFPLFLPFFSVPPFVYQRRTSSPYPSPASLTLTLLLRLFFSSFPFLFVSTFSSCPNAPVPSPRLNDHEAMLALQITRRELVSVSDLVYGVTP